MSDISPREVGAGIMIITAICIVALTIVEAEKNKRARMKEKYLLVEKLCDEYADQDKRIKCKIDALVQLKID